MRSVLRRMIVPSLLAVSATSAELPTAETGSDIDRVLRHRLYNHNVSPVTPPPVQNPALVKLGQSLFFDKELSGRRNISCATCHNTTLGSADAQSQSRAQGAIGLGPSRRQDGDARFDFLPRNALSLWNRGVSGWDVMFWDGRLSGDRATGFTSPAGAATPQNLSNALAAFTLFPITPDEEMRGFPGQKDIFGQINELGDLDDEDFTEIWRLITARIVNNDGYQDLLSAAFPDVKKNDINITHIGEATGAFMTEAFTALDSPFDRYLAGDNSAMSTNAKRGAYLFYGRANCSSCHSGALQTDLGFHNIAAPQVGTGRGDFAPFDIGRGAITNKVSDKFKFRTPSLRNIALEAPYFHNGAFAKLEDAVRHHLNPRASLANYDDSQVAFELRGTYQPQINGVLLSTMSSKLAVAGRPLSDKEVSYIMDFLSALTDPGSLNLHEQVPDRVASGLPVPD